MRRFIALFVILILSPITPCAAQDRDLDESEVFLQAFLLLKRSKDAEEAGDLETALRKCEEAKERYAFIRRRWPTWNTEMLDYRWKRVGNDLNRLRRLATDAGVNPASSTLSLPQHRNTPGATGTNQNRPSAIARMPRGASPRQQFKLMQDRLQRLENERKQLLRRSNDERSNRRAAEEALNKAEAEVARLRQDLAEAESELKRVANTGALAQQNHIEELTKQLSEALDSLTKANERTTDVLAAYDEAQKTIADLNAEQERLIQERDEMAALIKGLTTGETTGELITENMRLREQLNATRAQLDELKLDQVEDDEEIRKLREEVSNLRLELATVKKENDAYKRRLLELQGSLDVTELELASASDSDDPNSIAENHLLKNLIIRQLKQQAHRQQKRDLILQELEKLEAGSDDLVNQINELAAGMELTPQEKAALKAGNTPVESLEAGSPTDLPDLEADTIEKRITRSDKAAAFSYAQGRLEEAEVHYREILHFAPQHVETLCNLGVVKIRLNQLEEAREEFEKALMTDQQHSRSLYMLGITHFYLEDLENCVTSIKNAIDADPDNADYYHFLGVVYMKQTHLEEAGKTLAKALEMRPSFPSAHYNLTLLHLMKDKPDVTKARHHYEMARRQGLPQDTELENRFKMTVPAPQRIHMPQS